MAFIMVIAGVLVLAAVAGVLIIRTLICICQPNEALVISGTRRRMGDRILGYRLILGGRGIRIPMLERVDRLDLSNMIIELRVKGAYSRGGIPLNVDGVANVKIGSDEHTIANAIERFLGKPRQEILNLAKDTLEGNLRGVLATLTPEEVNHDRVKFATSLLAEAETDLRRIGLVLDTMKIQHVSDDRGFLDSIGRRQSADVQMRSRIAEAENQAQAAERNAQNYEEKELARLDAEITIARADAQRRIVEARAAKQALIAEQRGEVAAQVARAEAELEVQHARVDQVRLQLIADRLKPAEAWLDQMRARARGDAAKIVEEGRAIADALAQVGESWRAAGPDARAMFVAQHLEQLVDRLMTSAQASPVQQVTVVDPRLADAGGGLAVKAGVATELLRETAGIDLAAFTPRRERPVNDGGPRQPAS